MKKSLYETLEINETSDASEIKKAYRKLARKYHPDVNKDAGAEDKFKELNAAYEVLSDKEKKLQYDQHGDSMFGGQNFHDFARGQSQGVDLDDILRQMFNGGGSGFGNSSFGGFEPDLDMNAQITISFETSVLGGKQHISLNHDAFDIKIPEGIKDGQKIRAKGKGKAQGSQKGDLIIVVNVEPSALYKREDDTLTKSFDVPLKTALFGGKIKISTIKKDITLKMPENTKAKQSFRVKNLGVYNIKTKETGDLYLKVNIILPKIEDLSEDLIELLKDKLPSDI